MTTLNFPLSFLLSRGQLFKVFWFHRRTDSDDSLYSGMHDSISESGYPAKKTKISDSDIEDNEDKQEEHEIPGAQRLIR